jgi:hypothetical protein
MIAASDWREVVKNSLRGFCILTLKPSGIVLHDCQLHERDGKRWVALPSKPRIDGEGRHLKDQAGKPLYTRLVEIQGKAERERFQVAALAAIDALLLGEGES